MRGGRIQRFVGEVGVPFGGEVGEFLLLQVQVGDGRAFPDFAAEELVAAAAGAVFEGFFRVAVGEGANLSAFALVAARPALIGNFEVEVEGVFGAAREHGLFEFLVFFFVIRGEVMLGERQLAADSAQDFINIRVAVEEETVGGEADFGVRPEFMRAQEHGQELGVDGGFTAEEAEMLWRDAPSPRLAPAFEFVEA